MKLIRFTDPLGPGVPNPDLDDILEKLSANGEEYWHNPSFGWGVLDLQEDGDSIALVTFTKFDKLGFYVDYQEFPADIKRRNQFFAWNGSTDKRAVSLHFSGEEPVFAPRYLFVGEIEMKDIVKTFFLKGKRSRKVKWITQKKLRWRFGTGTAI